MTHHLSRHLHFIFAFIVLFAFSLSIYGQGQVSMKTKPKPNPAPVTKKRSAGNGTASKAKVTRNVRPSRPTRPSTPSTSSTQDEDDENWFEYDFTDDFVFFGYYEDKYVDNATAQTYLKGQLNEKDNLSTGVLTNRGGCLIFGSNVYATNKVPQAMIDALKYCSANKYKINDVALTESGYWCVVYADYYWKGNVPSDLRETLDESREEKDKIYSVSISEQGQAAMISEKYCWASSEYDRKCLKVAKEHLGTLTSISITDKATLIVGTEGILGLKIPINIVEALKNASTPIHVIRFTDSGTYIAIDKKNSRRAFYM